MSIENQILLVYTPILVAFLPNIYKIGMIHILLNRCFHVCPNRSMFHSQLTLVKEVFYKNRYSEKCTDRCFKSFLSEIQIL